MPSAEKQKTEIEQLSEEQFSRLRKWFAQRDREEWDKQIKKDSDSGNLDFLKNEVEEAKNEGDLNGFET